MTTKDKWVWMPHPAHFICSQNCQFFLSTKVGKYIISTVGEYWPDQAVRRIHAEIHDPQWWADHKMEKGDNFDHEYMKKFGFEDIGYNRKYETMVFNAVKSDKDIKCCPFRQASGRDIDFVSYNSAEDAYKGHMKMCLKYAKKG